MNNIEVLKKFINKEQGATPKRQIQYGYFIQEGRTLQSNAEKLINYTTTIAEWTKDNKVKLNITKYSRTTSKIQSQLTALLQSNNIDYITYTID